MKRALFVGDGGRSDDLEHILSRHGVAIVFNTRRLPVKLPVLARHWQYAKLAFHAARSRRDYDAIFIWQQYIALYYYIISFVFRADQRPVCVYYIIFRPSRWTVFTWIKKSLMMKMMTASHVYKVYFMSKSDMLYTFVSKEKKDVLNSLYTHSDFVEARIGDDTIRNGEYFFSGGANNRDFLAMKSLAEELPEKNFVIACLPKDAARVDPCPPNMIIFVDAYDEKFDELILRSKAVIIPIIDPNVMSGQLVCIRAMQCAKPVYITKSNFMRDWLADLDSLSFITEYSGLAELRSILVNQRDQEFYKRGLEARRYYLDRLSSVAFNERIAMEILSAIESVNT